MSNEYCMSWDDVMRSSSITQIEDPLTRRPLAKAKANKKYSKAVNRLRGGRDPCNCFDFYFKNAGNGVWLFQDDDAWMDCLDAVNNVI